MDQELLTLKQIAERLNLPTSTVSYYRQTFAEYIPGQKVGRYMKYEPEAINIISKIAECFSNNLQQQQVRETLSREFALNIEQNSDYSSGQESAATTTQQQRNNNVLAVYEEWKKAENKALAQANSEIYYLRELVQQQQATIDQLSNKLLQIEAPRPWWKRIFDRE